MQRSPATRSTTQLPPHGKTLSNAERSRDASSAKKALSASISAAALLQARDVTASESTSPIAARPTFVITDLLKPSNELALLPLSPIKHNVDSGVSPPLDIFVQSSERQQSQQQHKAHTQYLKRLDDPENVELFAYASALCHRITGKYLPKALLQRDADAQKHEIERIQRDPEILKAIATIRTLSTQFKSVARDTMGHRKELGHALFRIEESYLKLFEKLMEISLRMYWKYEQERESERAADKASIVHWKERLAWKTAEWTKLQKLVEAKDSVLKTQAIQLRDLEQQLDDASSELEVQRDLALRVRELTRTGDELREKERMLQDDLLRLQRKHEEMLVYERTQQDLMREQQRRLTDELRATLRDKDAVILKQDSAIRELSIASIPVVLATHSTQTEVDDDGLWDAQDGIPCYVSKSTLHRMLWRRFNAFVTCKNCHGRPIAAAKGSGADRSAQLGEDARDYVDVWSLERRDKITKKETKRIESIELQWQLPAPVVLFLSNLPKSVMAFPFYSLEHVITEIEAIYDDKFASDVADEADGVAREELAKFICEFFLKTHGLRQSAEVALYRLLISVKNMYQRNSHVKLFARFLDLLHDSEPSHLHQRDTDTAADTSQRWSDSSTKATLVAHANDAVAVPQAPSKKKRVGYLDRSFLHVFLTARYYLLRPPPVVAHSKTKGAKITAVTTAANGKPRPNATHVVQLEPTKKWVSLDHAVSVLKWYISYLSDESVVSYCREVEHNTAIYMGGALTEVSGNRLTVRAEMRRAMLASETGGGNNNSSCSGRAHDESENDRRVQPRIVADVHRVLLLLLDALEQRQEVMERDLVALFDAGDTNHDCVLSFNEFKAIIRTRVPHFSDRRILRMFREALMGSEDQSFALSMAAFVAVCSDHGLVSLLPVDRLQDPFESTKRPLRLTQATKDASRAETLSPAFDALTSPVQRLAVSTAAKQAVGHTDESATPVELLELPGASEIPEDLPVDSDSVQLSARAEEVEDEDAWSW